MDIILQSSKFSSTDSQKGSWNVKNDMLAPETQTNCVASNRQKEKGPLGNFPHGVKKEHSLRKEILLFKFKWTLTESIIKYTISASCLYHIVQLFVNHRFTDHPDLWLKSCLIVSPCRKFLCLLIICLGTIKHTSNKYSPVWNIWMHFTTL